MDRGDHPVLFRPRHQWNIVKRSLDCPEPCLCEPNTFCSDLFEVLLAQAGFQDHRPCVNTHSARPVLLVTLHRRYCECLDPFRISRPAGDVHLRRGYCCRDAAMNITVEETDGLLPGGIVAERVVNLRINKP